MFHRGGGRGVSWGWENGCLIEVGGRGGGRVFNRGEGRGV